MQTGDKHLGILIKQVRMAAGLSQIQIARKLGTSTGSWNHYERGIRRISLVDAFKIEHVMSLPEPVLSNWIIAADYKEATGRSRLLPLITGVDLKTKPGAGGEKDGVITVPVRLPKDIYLKLEFHQ